MTKLEELLKTIKRDHVYIQMHKYPDHDSLAAAFGLQTLLGHKGKRSTICYNGKMDKVSTIKMIELLKIVSYHIDDVEMTPEDEIILVDGQIRNSNMGDFPGKEIGCIDHHPVDDVSDYLFYDIRSDVGACATIVAEYFVENQIEITSDVATALLYGLKVDTANLTRKVTDLDVDMFGYLFKHANGFKLREIDNCSLAREDLVAYQEAISNLTIEGRIGIARIGDECPEAVIGSISDFLMSLSEVDITLVYSHRVGGLKFSVRSESKYVDAGKLIKEALVGYGDGGGHANMAAGFIPDLSSDEEIIVVSSLVEQRMKQIVIQKLEGTEK